MSLFQILIGNLQLNPVSFVPDQTLKIVFGCKTPLSVQDCFPFSETSLQPFRFTDSLLIFLISTYSVLLSTLRIAMEPALVAGRLVAVGSGVTVSVGSMAVEVAVVVGAAVTVGSAVELGNVGNGVKVSRPKLYKGVGVAVISPPGSTLGPGTTFDALRERSRPTGMEQRAQRTGRDKQENRILPVCPCWLYRFFHLDMNESSPFMFSMYLAIDCGHLLLRVYPPPAPSYALVRA